MKTTLYLVRQAARLGIRQAELTRDFLAVRPLDACYSSPMPRAIETARRKLTSANGPFLLLSAM